MRQWRKPPMTAISRVTVRPRKTIPAVARRKTAAQTVVSRKPMIRQAVMPSRERINRVAVTS